MVDDDNVHQQPANPSCLRINSTINSFFMTCHAGIRDTKLEGYEEKFTYKKIDVALQATLEGTWLQYHAQLEITAPLRSKVLISRNLKRRRKIVTFSSPSLDQWLTLRGRKSVMPSSSLNVWLRRMLRMLG
ncbi:hypothetical protein GBA52_026019 [Prunus armeniaca]|nr:hypothetical protein GBA52_026019 [Prunus armeniaca]